jgi:hypothetical protein
MTRGVPCLQSRVARPHLKRKETAVAALEEATDLVLTVQLLETAREYETRMHRCQ